MSQSVNSQAVLRMMGRGAPPIRGRGGSTSMERGRGRGNVLMLTPLRKVIEQNMFVKSTKLVSCLIN